MTTKTKKQQKYPSEGEWINELWYIQAVEYYSPLKRSGLSSHEKAWRNLIYILLSEGSQSEKAAYYMIPTIWHSRKGKTVKTAKRSTVVSSCGWRKG